MVKVLDFGLARLQHPECRATRAVLTQLGSVIGTPDFVAPEQAFNSQTADIGPTCIVWVAPFYWLLAGRVPFPGGSMPEKLVRHYKEDVQPVQEARCEQLQLHGHGAGPPPDAVRQAAAIPAKVVQIVDRLMAKESGRPLSTTPLSWRKCWRHFAGPSRA